MLLDLPPPLECDVPPSVGDSSSVGLNSDIVSPPPIDSGVCDLDPAATLPMGEKLDVADSDNGLTVRDNGDTVRGDTGEALSIFVSDIDPRFPIHAACFLPTVPGVISWRLAISMTLLPEILMFICLSGFSSECRVVVVVDEVVEMTGEDEDADDDDSNDDAEDEVDS